MTHPSRWSRSTLTTRASPRYVHIGYSGSSITESQPITRSITSFVNIHLVVECGIHGEQNTNPANLQCCCCIEAEPGFVPTSVQIVAVNTLLILGEVAVLDSFLHPEVPRVDVFRSLSCSQSIRQRIRCRTATLYFNLHWTSLEHRSQ